MSDDLQRDGEEQMEAQRKGGAEHDVNGKAMEKRRNVRRGYGTAEYGKSVK